MQQKTQAIIFDVDGVLFHSVNEHGKFLWSANAKEDLGLTSEHFRALFSPDWDKVTRGELSTHDYLERVFAGFPQLGLSAQFFIDYWLARDAHINEGVFELAKSLNVPVYLGTNQEAHRMAHIERLVGRYFAGVFASYKMGHLKPNSGFYEHIERALNLTGDALVLIDDTAVNVQAAQNRGWQAQHFTGDVQALSEFLND